MSPRCMATKKNAESIKTSQQQNVFIVVVQVHKIKSAVLRVLNTKIINKYCKKICI